MTLSTFLLAGPVVVASGVALAPVVRIAAIFALTALAGAVLLPITVVGELINRHAKGRR